MNKKNQCRGEREWRAERGRGGSKQGKNNSFHTTHGTVNYERGKLTRKTRRDRGVGKIKKIWISWRCPFIGVGSCSGGFRWGNLVMQFCCSGCGALGWDGVLHMDPYPLKSISSQSLCTVHRYVLNINVPLISTLSILLPEIYIIAYFHLDGVEAPSKYHRKCLSGIFRGAKTFWPPKLSRTYVFTNVGRTIYVEITWEFLKGQCHEIFDFRFSIWIGFPQAPGYTIRAVSNFLQNSRRYSQFKVHQCCR